MRAHLGNYKGPIWATYGFCPPVSYGSHVWVAHMSPDPAHIIPRYCPQFCPVGPGTVLVRLIHKGPTWVAQLGFLILVKSNIAQTLVSRAAMWQQVVISKQK